MPDSNLIKLRKKTYLKMIENSVGARLFNSLFVKFKDTGSGEVQKQAGKKIVNFCRLYLPLSGSSEPLDRITVPWMAILAILSQ